MEGARQSLRLFNRQHAINTLVAAHHNRQPDSLISWHHHRKVHPTDTGPHPIAAPPTVPPAHRAIAPPCHRATVPTVLPPHRTIPLSPSSHRTTVPTAPTVPPSNRPPSGPSDPQCVRGWRPPSWRIACPGATRLPLGSAADHWFPACGALPFCWRRHASPAPGCACSAPSLAECSSCLSPTPHDADVAARGSIPVVSTAADTHSVKPSSGLSLPFPPPSRTLSDSDVPHEP